MVFSKIISEYKTKKTKIEVNVLISKVATLLGISLSTSRGVIFERLGKEGIADIILPVVSPQKMLV